MKSFRLFSFVTVVFAGFGTIASGNDSTVTLLPDAAQSSAAVAVSDSIAVPDTFVAFSVLQKKYLKTCIVTNVLYAGGFGLLYGVVVPRSEKAGDDIMDNLKLLPLNYLAVGMMYASLPVSIVSSHRAKKNYEYYYKTAPQNITLPMTFTGAGLSIAAVGSSAWQMTADYRDNREMDGSYNKYGKLTMGFLTAGLVTFWGTNLYALAYTVILGEKAKRHSVAPAAATESSLYITPMRYGDANGCLLTWNF